MTRSSESLSRWLVRALSLCLISAFGCAAEWTDPTLVRIAVYSDTRPSRIEVMLVAPDGSPQASAEELSPQGPEQAPFLFSFVVHRANAERKTQRVRLRALYEDGSGQAELMQTFTVQFQEQTALFASVVLPKACRGVRCPDGQSCRSETLACVDDAELLPTTLYTEARDEVAAPNDYRGCGVVDGFCPPRSCAPSEDPDCKPAPGSACTTNEECGGSPCVGGRCCAGACGGDACQRCDVAGVCQMPDYETDPSHCGGCGVSCDYRRCVAGSCAPSAKLPPGPPTGGTSTHDPRWLYLTVMPPLPIGVEILALGLHAVAFQERASVKLFVYAESGIVKPGKLLGGGSVPLVADRRDATGEVHGTELRLDPPIPAPAGRPIWVGFVLSDAADLGLRSPSALSRAIGTGLIDESFDGSPERMPALEVLDPSLSIDEPLVYLIHSQKE